MNGSQLQKVMITPAEAMQLFTHAGTEEAVRAIDLYKTYRAERGVRYAVLWDSLDPWDIMCLLSFVYDTGRIQGIREERARKR